MKKKKVHLAKPNQGDPRCDSCGQEIVVSYCGWKYNPLSPFITEDIEKATCKGCLKVQATLEYIPKIHYRADVKYTYSTGSYVSKQAICGLPYIGEYKKRFTSEESEVTCKTCKKYLLGRVIKSL